MTAVQPRRFALRGDERAALLFLLPWLVGLVAFLILPLIWGIWISLTDEQIVKVGSFVGVANYQEILTDDPLFIQSLGVTLRWIVLTTPLFGSFLFQLTTSIVDVICGESCLAVMFGL